MPNNDLKFFAKWTPRTDTPYTVEHSKELLGSSQYELTETENKTDTTDA